MSSLTHYEEALRLVARPALRPNQAGFDGFPEAHFVGNQQLLQGGLDEFEDRDELVGVEVDVRRLHRIHHVGEGAAQFFEGEEGAEDIDTGVFPACHEVLHALVQLRIENIQGGQEEILGACRPGHLRFWHQAWHRPTREPADDRRVAGAADLNVECNLVG